MSSCIKSVFQFFEEYYNTATGLDINQFIKVHNKNNHNPGELLIKNDLKSSNVDISLLFNQDIYEASENPKNNNFSKISVLIEEISHFYYFACSHNKGRNITLLELEIQSEIDRILAAYLCPEIFTRIHAQSLLHQMLFKKYQQPQYELSRQIAKKFYKSLKKNPKNWTYIEKKKLLKFFYSDLGEKIHLSSYY